MARGRFWFCKCLLMGSLGYIALIVLTTLSPGVYASINPASAHLNKPRAAIFALVSESKLTQMVESVRQLETSFNGKYHYNWVFFSSRELSEEFKQETSNATKADCIYELIPEDHWSVPSWINIPRFEAGLESRYGKTRSPSKRACLPNSHHTYRWTSGLFARERRLREYDWFWKVEPGAQFYHEIDFDVFRFMRDNGMVYGSSKTSRDEIPESCSLWQHQTPHNFLGDMVRREKIVPANIHREDPSEHGGDGCDNPEAHMSSLAMIHRRRRKDERVVIFEGKLPKVQVELQDYSGTPSPFETSPTWLDRIYNMCTLRSTFKMGSLGFFRGPHYSAYFDLLDLAGEFYYAPIEDPSIHTISASILSPEESLWMVAGADLRCTGDGIWCEDGLDNSVGASFPGPTPDPDPDFYQDLLDSRGSGLEKDDFLPKVQRDETYRGTYKNGLFILLGDPSDDIASRHKMWKMMTEDFLRQHMMPGLMSGHTVIDERSHNLGSQAGLAWREKSMGQGTFPMEIDMRTAFLAESLL